MLFGGTSLVTTLPAPTMAFSPIVMLERIVAPDPMDAPFLITVRSTFQSASVCRFAVGGRGARIGVVDERDAVADEDVVFNRDALADKRMARDLAALADGGILLDFDKGSNLRLIPDFASVQIDELGELHIAP